MKQLVKVLWRDATTLKDDSDQVWYTEDELKKLAKEGFSGLSVSVGYIIEKNKRYIVIAPNIDSYGKVYSDVSMIPMGNVVSIKKL